MQKKSMWILIAVLLIAAGVGSYFIFRKSSEPKTSSTSTSTNKSPNTANKDTTKDTTLASTAVVQTKNDTKAGDYLVGNNGKTLYTYDSDTPGVSNCSGSCLTV